MSRRPPNLALTPNRLILAATGLVAVLAMTPVLAQDQPAEPAPEAEILPCALPPEEGSEQPEAGDDLSEQLAPCDGVLQPPAEGSSGILVPPPDVGTTPVIPPSAIEPDPSAEDDGDAAQ